MQYYLHTKHSLSDANLGVCSISCLGKRDIYSSRSMTIMINLWKGLYSSVGDATLTGKLWKRIFLIIVTFSEPWCRYFRGLRRVLISSYWIPRQVSAFYKFKYLTETAVVWSSLTHKSHATISNLAKVFIGYCPLPTPREGIWSGRNHAEAYFATNPRI